MSRARAGQAEASAVPATSSPRPTAQGFCPWEAVTVTLSSHPPLTPLSGLPCAAPSRGGVLLGHEELLEGRTSASGFWLNGPE